MFKKVNLLLTLLCITSSGLHSNQDAFVPNLEMSKGAVNPNDDHDVPDLKRKRVDSDNLENRTPTYTFNFLALNPYLGETSYMYGGRDRYESEQNILSLLYKTAATMATHQGSVNLWIDSHSTSSILIDYFRQKFTSYGAQNPYYAPILIRDIRSLDQVKRNPEVFSSNFPELFISDLAGVIATLETLKKGKESYFVYSDLTLVKPLRHEKLFTPKVRNFLDIYGAVFQGVRLDNQGNTWFSNQFYIVSKDDEDICEALQHAVVDLNIARAQAAVQPYQRNILHLVVNFSFEKMLEYLQSLKGLCTLINETTQQPYDKDKDGFNPFLILPINNTIDSFFDDCHLSSKVHTIACQQYFGYDYAPQPVTFKPKHYDY